MREGGGDKVKVRGGEVKGTEKEARRNERVGVG